MDPLTIGMLVILAVLIFFMFRNGQKRKKDQEALQSKVVPGADVMTNFGLFGTIVSIDEEDNKVDLQVSPGVEVKVHRQTITRVIEKDDAVDEQAQEPGDDASSPTNGDQNTDNA